MLSRRQTAKSGDLSYEQQQTYSDYYDTYSGQTRPNAEILLNGADFQSADCAQYEVGSYTGEEDGSTRDNALIWNSADGSFTYTIQVPETGVYSIEATYCPLVSNTSEISFSLAIDGEIPYDTASRLTLNKVYRNKEDMKEDSKGNQVRPTQVQTEMWRTCWIGDSDGLFNEPLLFYLEQGTHEITLSSQKAYFALESLRFAQPEEVPTYAEYVSSTDAAVSPDTGGMVGPFVGMDNYNYAFNVDPNYRQYLLKVLKDTAWKTPLILVFSLFVAVILNQKFKGRTFSRAVFFLPVIIATGPVYNIINGNLQSTGNSDASQFSTMFSTDLLGDLMQFLGIYGISDGMQATIETVSDNIFGIVWNSGIQILIFLAALQNIPVSAKEAAQMEGATAWEYFWKITLPYVSPREQIVWMEAGCLISILPILIMYVFLQKYFTEGIERSGLVG